MKKFEELTFNEQEEVLNYFYNWMKNYTDKVIKRVMKNFDEILNNEFAFNMIKELYEREMKEKKEEARSLRYLICNYEDFEQYDIRNHCLEHSDSYRDVLYDMFIRE